MSRKRFVGTITASTKDKISKSTLRMSDDAISSRLTVDGVTLTVELSGTADTPKARILLSTEKEKAKVLWSGDLEDLASAKSLLVKP